MRNNTEVGPQVRRRRNQPKWLSFMAAASVVGGFQASTKMFAHTFANHPSLGGNIAGFYPPWGIVEWAHRWHQLFPNELLAAGSIGVVIAGAGVSAVGLTRMLADRSAKATEFLHGSAKWAERSHIEGAGLLPAKGAESQGVYVGGWQDKKGAFHYLRHNGPEHVLTYAPTRSGKGVGLVIPTLLSWPASAIVTDLKGELWALTAGWRKQYANNSVLKFEPAAGKGCARWNPLDEIRIGTEFEVGDVQNIAQLIVDPDGKGLESHWSKTAFALLVGVILHALYKARHDGTTATLPLVDRMLADPERGAADLWVEMATFEHTESGNHHAVGTAARDMMDRPEEEAGSVLSTAKSFLSLYRDPVVAANVSESHFRIKDLMHHENPVTVFAVTQPNDKARLRPLIRIFINMSIRLLAEGLTFEGGRPVANYKHKLLMLMDEFPSLGKLAILQESLAFLAGYGIKCYLICQDINQLKDRDIGYGPDESITSNCHIQNAYPPTRIESAEHLSKLTGTTTVVKEQITTSGRRLAVMLGQVSRSLQEVQRPLLTPDECQRMPGPKKKGDDIVEAGDMVIYVAGYPAIYGKQPLYFKDPIFQKRAAVAAPLHSDRTREPASNLVSLA